MRLIILFGKVYLLISFVCISTQVHTVSAKPAQPKSVETKKKFSYGNSKLPPLNHDLTNTGKEKTNADLINVSGKWYPKNSVGDFNRTKGLDYRVKQKHVIPQWGGPIEPLFTPNLMKKVNPYKPSIRGKKKRKKKSNSELIGH